MKRRTVLQSLALVTGVSLSPVALQLAIAAERAPGGFVASERSLSSRQLQLLDALVETIIPETDTPGASEAGVAGYIDLVFSRAFSDQQREMFTIGLGSIQDICAEKYSLAFERCTEEQQLAVLTGVAAQPAHNETGSAAPVSFFFLLKELTIIGYYTSEIGASQELRYQAIPSSHEQCITVDDSGTNRAWFSTSLF